MFGICIIECVIGKEVYNVFVCMIGDNGMLLYVMLFFVCSVFVDFLLLNGVVCLVWLLVDKCGGLVVLVVNECVVLLVFVLGVVVVK